MERSDGNLTGQERGASDGATATAEPSASGGTYGEGSGGTARDAASRAREVLEQAKDRAQDGWTWVRQNPWPVIGAVVGIGAVLAWRRRGDASHRLAHMESDHPVGETHGHSFHTDRVAEGMTRGLK